MIRLNISNETNDLEAVLLGIAESFGGPLNIDQCYDPTSQKKYFRLNNVLREKGFTVEKLKYSEISKMGGLLRCSTMPLRRKK